MKKQPVKRERRGTFLQTTKDSAQALKRIYDRMMAAATTQGESMLIRKIFSH
jgi:hypothetical protein